VEHAATGHGTRPRYCETVAVVSSCVQKCFGRLIFWAAAAAARYTVRLLTADTVESEKSEGDTVVEHEGQEKALHEPFSVVQIPGKR
jgi:hypothetical protein